jgi:hypothetical protein
VVRRVILLSTISVILLAALPAVPAQAWWAGRACRTHSTSAQVATHKVCVLINIHDLYQHSQGLFQLHADNLIGAKEVYVDYVRLFRNGVVVRTANPDRWYTACGSCSPNYVSTPWRTSCDAGELLYKADARYRLHWRSGGFSSFFTIQSNGFYFRNCYG